MEMFKIYALLWIINSFACNANQFLFYNDEARPEMFGLEIYRML